MFVLIILYLWVFNQASFELGVKPKWTLFMSPLMCLYKFQFKKYHRWPYNSYSYYSLKFVITCQIYHCNHDIILSLWLVFALLLSRLFSLKIFVSLQLNPICLFKLMHFLSWFFMSTSTYRLFDTLNISLCSGHEE